MLSLSVGSGIGGEWIWSFQWRRQFFEWKNQYFFELQVLLSQVVLNQQVEDKIVCRHDKEGIFLVKSFVKAVG